MIEILPYLTDDPQSVASLALRASVPESAVWEAIRVWECEHIATADGMRYRLRDLRGGRMVNAVQRFENQRPLAPSGYGRVQREVV